MQLILGHIIELTFTFIFILVFTLRLARIFRWHDRVVVVCGGVMLKVICRIEVFRLYMANDAYTFTMNVLANANGSNAISRPINYNFTLT